MLAKLEIKHHSFFMLFYIHGTFFTFLGLKNFFITLIKCTCSTTTAAQLEPVVYHTNNEATNKQQTTNNQ